MGALVAVAFGRWLFDAASIDARRRLEPARCGDAWPWLDPEADPNFFPRRVPDFPGRLKNFRTARRPGRRSATTLPPRFDRTARQGRQQCQRRCAPMLEGMDRHRDAAQWGRS